MIGNQIAGFFSVGAPPAPATAYESIQTVTVGSGGSSSISFSSIPSTYKHLQIRAFSRNSGYSGNTPVLMRFNGDTGTNYATHYLTGNGSSAGAGASPSDSWVNILRVPGSSDLANAFGTSVTDILDYANTNKYKTSRALSGYDINGGGEVHLYSGLWMNTAAITSITILPNVGTLAQYSSFALYGITGA